MNIYAGLFAAPCKWINILTCWKRQHARCVVQGFDVLDGQDETDVVWAGDMNWSTDDGQPPLPAGWYGYAALVFICARFC